MVRSTVMRRAGGMLAATVLMATALIGTAAALSVPPAGTLPFKAIRNGDSQLGTHRLSFRKEGDDLIMEKEIRFKVEVGFITFYRYEHTNREVWRDGRLIALDTQTNDDGDKWTVSGRATEEGFVVDGNFGRVVAPADILPTSWWNVGVTRATQLLDTQRGRLMDVSVEQLGEEKVVGASTDTPAKHYRIRLLTNAPPSNIIDIWYDSADTWVKMAFDASGQAITYELDGALSQLRRAELVAPQTAPLATPLRTP